MHQKKLLLPLKFSNLEKKKIGSGSLVEFINAANIAGNVFVSSLL